MSRTRPPYAPEFRHQMVELVRAGRSPEDLAQEFEPTAQSIRNWVCQADLDEGRRHDGLTTDEREELRRLRRENRQLRLEREILAKAAACVVRSGDRLGATEVLEFVRANQAIYPVATMCRMPGCLLQPVLCVAGAWALSPCTQGRGLGSAYTDHPQAFSRDLWSSSGSC